MRDIAAYYDQLAAEHGHSPQAVDASSQAALEARYRSIGDAIDMNGKQVLEVGCGHGGLGAYLTARYPEITYRGIDVSLGLLQIGREQHPGLRLYHANVLMMPSTRYDVVVAQGVFYLLGGDAWARTVQLVSKMWSLCGDVTAFTALTTWGRKTGNEFRVDPARTLETCHSLAQYVSFRHDYHRGDGMFAMYRNPQ